MITSFPFAHLVTLVSTLVGSIPFLDIKVTRGANGNLVITIYHKPTYTDRYLHFQSHHPTHVKKGLVKCHYDQARSITN